MVWAGVSQRGKTAIIFCEEGNKINAESYREDILKVALPKMKRVFRGTPLVFQQDNAPSHRAKSTQDYLKEKVSDLIDSDRWPANSPDLNPMDYSVWGALKKKVYRSSSSTTEDLKAAIVKEWRALSQDFIDNAILQWRKRLRLVIQQNDGHIEHLL